MKIKRVLAVCFAAVLMFLSGCSLFGGKGTNYIAGDALTDSSVVRWIGRTEYSQEEEKMYTYFAATGFTVNFTGTTLYVTYHATNTDSDKNRPYFVCMVDGQTADEGTAFCLTEENQTVQVLKNLTNTKHTATILKRSEPENSLTSISAISTDGKFLRPTQHTGMRFQIIGSSGITGHGCFGTNPAQAWTTENSSALHGFGYLAAQKFGAECQFASASGMGMVWSYRGVSPMTETYEATGLIASYNPNGSTKSVTKHGQWDHTSWTPDVIIANIGGNDWNKEIYNSQTETVNEEKAAQFKEAVEALLTRIHTLYPNARIVWACNSTTSGNGGLANEVVQTLSFKNRIHLVGIDNSKTGADNHANLATQRANATIVANAITERFGIPQI